MAKVSRALSRGVYIFPVFERFWHWSQAALIIFLMMTGAEIHGFWTVFGFERALDLHIVAAFTLLVLWAFAIFWHFVTGQWRHYVPTTDRLRETVSFYITGIFLGARHPFQPSVRRKHNPLQAVAYLCFKLFMAPAAWISGILLWVYGRYPVLYPDALPAQWASGLHVAAAFLIAAFLIAHLYLITTGETVTSQLRAMITGWDMNGETETPGTRSDDRDYRRG